MVRCRAADPFGVNGLASSVRLVKYIHLLRTGRKEVFRIADSAATITVRRITETMCLYKTDDVMLTPPKNIVFAALHYNFNLQSIIADINYCHALPSAPNNFVG